MSAALDWSLVRAFIAVLDRGSLLAASKQLQTTQPTVSRHIAELEATLGYPLFERTGRGLTPTQAALRLADAARMMDEGAVRFAQAASGSDPAEIGAVRISASQAVSAVLLPPILFALREVEPGLQIELVSTNDVSNLLRREADIAVRMVQPTQSSLIARRIGEVKIRAFASKTFVRRHKVVVKSLPDLLRYPLIGGDRDQSISRGLGAFGVTVNPEHFALRTDDLIVQWRAVQAGMGIGFLSRYFMKTDRSLVDVAPTFPIPSLPVWLAVHQEIKGNPRIRRVYDFLASAIAQALKDV